jgi:hypothetical protein
MDGLAGVTAIETSWGAPTVSIVLALTDPIVAVIVAEPTPELTADPCDPVLLLITATVADELVQVTFVVMSFVLWSV